jgi:hypothetical protein
MGKQILSLISKQIIILIICSGISSSYGQEEQEILYYQSFEESGSYLPSGWMNIHILGTGNWRSGIGAGEFTAGQLGIPDTAAYGQYNVYFRVPSTNPHITRLISPPINLEFSVYPELSFWHAQAPRNGSHSKLVVYYSENINGPWFPLANYQEPVNTWTERVFQLPSGIPSLYLAFEGHSGGGTPGSVCVDEVKIVETGEMPRYLSSVTSTQASIAFIPTGSENNPVLRTEFRVMGNTGSVTLEQFTVHSLNTDDADLSPSGVKLWFTTTQTFRNPVLIGNGQDFTNGQLTFTNLNHNLPTGYSYIWVTYDISSNATHGNFADAKLPANGILVNSETYPTSEHNPPGRREIRQTLFYDNFETDKGWLINGEWQRAIPQGLGGFTPGQNQTEGPAGPSSAFSGTRVLGTDITGLGTFPGNYEPHLEPEQWQAIMPSQDFFYYNNLTLSFQRWLNVYFFDRASIDMSLDGGVSWQNIWQNQLVNNTSNWSQVSYALPLAARQNNVLLRFSLGDTGGTNLQSGWNIDEVVITGTFVKYDVGVADILAPVNGCGMSSQEEVTVRVQNFGAYPSPELIPLAFSLNGGSSWQRDTLYGSIPVGESVIFTFGPKADFSIPGRYNNVLIKTEMPDDQDLTNDQLHTQIFSIPTYTPSLTENFQQNDGFWTGYGQNSSWHRAIPSATHIQPSEPGSFAWITNASGNHNALEFSWVESPCIDFSNIEHPVVEFLLNTHTLAGIDGVTLDYSLDEGQSWLRVDTDFFELSRDWHNHLSISSVSSYTGNGSGWTGTTGWINPRVVLPSQTSFQPFVRLRVLFASNPLEVAYEGAAIDNVKIYPVPYDVGIIALVGPDDDCELDQQQAITVAVSNLGINTLKQEMVIPLGIRDDLSLSESIEELILPRDLLPGDTIHYTFDQTFDFKQPGIYNFSAFTMLQENPSFWPGNNDNDTLSFSIQVFGYPTVFIGDDLFTTQPDTLLLNAGNGFSTYLWQDGSSLPSFQVSDQQSAYYHVRVTDENGCPATDSIWVKTWDLAVLELLSPTDGCQEVGGAPIKASIKNNGYDDFVVGTVIPLSLYFQEEWVEDMDYTLTSTLLPGQTQTVSFNAQSELLQLGTYDFLVIHHFEDAEPLNDTLLTAITAHGIPHVYIGDLIYTTQPDTIVLDPGPGYIAYLWQDGSNSQSFQVTDMQSAIYWVTITDENGCNNTDQVEIRTYDAAVSAIISPADACFFTSEEQVVVEIKNMGYDHFQAGSSFQLKLLVDHSQVAVETIILEQNWLPQQTIQYHFIQSLDLTAATSFMISVGIDFQDANIQNNNLLKTVNSTGFPQLQLPDLIITNQPDTLVLDAGEGYHSYLWSTGHTGQILHVPSFGTYWVTVANEIGCSDTAYIEIIAETVDFAVSGIVSPGSACLGLFVDMPVTISIMNSGNGIIYPGEQMVLNFSAASTSASESFIIQEYLQPGDYVNYTFTQTLTVSQPGTVNIQAWLEHQQDFDPSNNQFSKMVHVHSLPQPELGDTIFNVNPTGIILSLTQPYQAYLWQDGSTQAQFQIISPNSAWYWVLVTDINGCQGQDSVFVLAYDLEVSRLVAPVSNCTLSATEKIIFELHNTGPDTFETGEVIAVGYSINSNPVISHNFVLQNSLLPGQKAILQFPNTANFSATTDHEVKLELFFRDANAANNKKQSVVNVAGLPQVNLGGNIFTSMPDTVVLFAGHGFSSYLWQNGVSTPHFHVQTFGWHWVVVTDQYGCKGGDTLYVGRPTGIHQPPGNFAGFSIYPNPARDYFTVRFSSSGTQHINFELISQNGVLIRQKFLQPSALIEEKIRIDDLPEGIYYVRLIENNETFVKKLVIAGK